MDIYYTHRADYVPTSTETTSTTATTSSTTSTTTEIIPTETPSPIPLILGGIIGFSVILVVAVVLFRKANAS